MSQKRDSLIARVSTSMAANRLKYLSLAPELGGADQLYYELRHLVELEKKLCRPNRTPIFLHELLRGLSPVYDRAFELGKRFDIGLETHFVSGFRFLEEFNPYRKRVWAPVVRDEIEWLLREPPHPKALKSLLELSRFNFPSYHELLHKIVMRFFPEPGGKKTYFYFIESLVGTQEALLALQLGTQLGKPLQAINAIYRIDMDGAPPRRDPPAMRERAGSLLTHLGYISGLRKAELRKRLPDWAPFDPREVVGYSEEFVNDINPRWFKRNHFTQRNRGAPTGSLPRPPRLKRLDFAYLAGNRAAVEELCAWMEELL